MILAIDTIGSVSKIAILGDNFKDAKEWTAGKTQAEELLPNIDRLFKKNDVKISDLTKIAVNIGPGESFTGTRIGVSAANALAYALKIPEVGIFEKDILELAKKSSKIEGGRMVVPVYNRPPNITISKKK